MFIWQNLECLQMTIKMCQKYWFDTILDFGIYKAKSSYRQHFRHCFALHKLKKSIVKMMILLFQRSTMLITVCWSVVVSGPCWIKTAVYGHHWQSLNPISLFPCHKYYNLGGHDLQGEMITLVTHGNSDVTLPGREELMAGMRHCCFS